MKVDELVKKTGFTALVLPSPEKEVTGGYTGDMPSWVMGHGKPGDAWITIMNNKNIVAVATLLDFSCIVVTDGSVIPENVLKLAKDEDVNILTSKKTAFEVSKEIADLL